MKRKNFWNCFAAFLALSLVAGCSDDASENNKPDDEGGNENNCANLCGNDKLDAGEICDGSAFADGAKVCPDGLVIKDESAFACTATCGLDFSRACAAPSCGDGKLNGGEACEGDAFADGAKACPGDMIEISNPVYSCTNTCQVDVSKACVSSICGDKKLTGQELCDGDLFADNAKVCPAGKKLVTDRNLFVCNACSVDDSYACIDENDEDPKLFFSEIRVQNEKTATSASHLYLEIGNFGAETILSDCKLVGINLDPDDSTKIASTYAFEYELSGVIGNIADDPKNVVTVCYETKEGWLESQYKDEPSNTIQECDSVYNYRSYNFYYCAYLCENDKDCIESACGDEKTVMEDINSDWAACLRKVEYKKLASECDITIPSSETDLVLSMTKSTFRSDKFWGLGLVCPDGVHDIIRVDGLSNSYGGSERKCNSKNNFMDATGDTIYSTSEEYWNNTKDSLMTSVDASPTYGVAKCGNIVIN